MKPDAAFGHAASAYPARLLGIEDALDRLFQIGARHDRSYATDRADILIFQKAAPTPIRIALPTLIRGSLVSNLLEFVDLESDRPIVAAEVDSLKTNL